VLGVALVVASFWLIVIGNGDWAARIGSAVVALSLLSAFIRSRKDVSDPSDGPTILDGGGAEDYKVSPSDVAKYQSTLRVLGWEFFGAILGTLINGYSGWLAAIIAR
jgi:hypothetical protein